MFFSNAISLLSSPYDTSTARHTLIIAVKYFSKVIYLCKVLKLLVISFAVENRYDRIKCMFVKIYGKQPLFCGRAPGRVNLIGKHFSVNRYYSGTCSV